MTKNSDSPRGADNLPRRALLDELFGRSRIAIEDAEEVDVEHAPDVVFREVQELLDLRDAGVGDHDGQGAESVDGFLDHGFNFL